MRPSRAVSKKASRSCMFAFTLSSMRALLIPLLLLGLIGCVASKKTAEPPQRIVLVSLDTVRYDHLSYSGYARATSPTIDELAKASMRFRLHRANSTFTTPSHMSMFTGRLPFKHGIHRPNGFTRYEQKEAFCLPREIPTIAEKLSSAGYRTYSFYSSRDFFLDPAQGFGRGVEKHVPFGMDSHWAAKRIREFLVKPSKEKQYIFIHSKRPHLPYIFGHREKRVFSKEKYQGNIISDAESFYSKRMPRVAPFRVNLFSIAYPGILPEQMIFRDQAETDRSKPQFARDRQQMIDLYDDALLATDTYFSQVLAGLKASPLWEKTLLIVTSDHGEEFAEHKRYGHQMPFEMVLHVPLLIHGPGFKAEDRTEPTQSVDLMPTILAAAGLPAEGYDGLDLSSAKLEPNRLIASATDTPFEPAARALVEGEWKLISRPLKKGFSLHHMPSDPIETRDLWTQDPSRAKRLQALMAAWPFFEAGPDNCL